MRSRSYSTANIPFVSNVPSYHNNWVKWWTSCQPAWHRKEWPLPRDNEGTTNWVRVGACGQNGLFLVVLSTAWWAYSVRSEKEWAEFDEAVEDVAWVIGQVIGSVKALQASQPDLQPAPSKTPQQPASSIAWMARETGKCQPKVSRKLLEALGA